MRFDDVADNICQALTSGHVARWLLQPAAPVQATVARTRKAVDSKGRFSFGLHLRLQKPMPAGGDKVGWCKLKPVLKAIGSISTLVKLFPRFAFDLKLCNLRTCANY